ncbi:MAG TPA: ParA family protein [Cyclobacteriaceae bacterium]|nr:ParA family protein [Cyclobacteriaceae bacterium]
MNKAACKVIAICNHKGGVAKTTTTINLGAALSKLGERVLLIDADPQSNLSQSLGLEDETPSISDVFALKVNELPIKKLSENLSLVPASLDLSAVEPSMYSNINSYFILKTQIDKIKSDYDYILIDCPPSLGILTQNALIAANDVLIIVQAQFLALKGLDTIYSLVQSVRDKLNEKISVLGMLLTQTNHTRISKGLAQSLRVTFKEKVFDTTIRQNVAIAEASANRNDIFSYAPESFGAIDYMNLAKEILQ